MDSRTPGGRVRGPGRLRALPTPRVSSAPGGSRDGDGSRASVPVPAPARTTTPVPLRGRYKLALIRDLATGEWNPDSLAVMYGITPEQVAAFQQEQATDIAEVSAALSGTLSVETSGLWLTKKQQRLAEYQQAIEDIDETIESLRNDGVNWSRAHRDMFRVRLDLYRAAADELGAYPQRTAAPARQGQGVQYIIDSEDAKDMT